MDKSPSNNKGGQQTKNTKKQTNSTNRNAKPAQKNANANQGNKQGNRTGNRSKNTGNKTKNAGNQAKNTGNQPKNAGNQTQNAKTQQDSVAKKTPRRRRRPNNRNKSNRNPDTKIFALGGLHEVGKNMYCVEHENELFIIDAGVKFAGDTLPGIDYVIPDYSYLKENESKIRGLIITHGHEDHIGGIPFLLKDIKIPFIYATPLAAAMIRRKLEEKRLLNASKTVIIDSDYVIKSKYFNIGFFKTNHSIPESQGVVLNTPNGRIIETGDFKFDLSPVGDPADFQKMSFLGETGVDLLLSDSTNAEVESMSSSEKEVARAVRDEFRKTEGRLIVATFASNVHRVQQIVEAAVKFNRKILVYGRSMENNIQVSRKLGYIKAPDNFFIKGNKAKNLPDNEILILCTGSQGEALAALSRIAQGTHRNVKIKPGDTVIFSSSPIPGNAYSINQVVNKLFRAGAKVLTNTPYSNLHTSGHASQEEQKLMLLLLKPKFFMPMHGEFKMLKTHAKLAMDVGMAEENTFVLANGDTLLLNNHEVRVGPRIQADDIFVDGNDSSGLSTAVLRDRTILSEDGMVSVLIAMDSHTGQLLKKPVLISRGFIYMKESYEMLKEAEYLVNKALKKELAKKTTFSNIKNVARETLSSYFYKKTQRNPMIIPVIMNKK